MNRREAARRKLLASLPKAGRCAEIGVWEGGFSELILEMTDPLELHLIDPWQYMPEFPNTGFGRRKNRTRMEDKYQNVVEKFANDGRVTIHRATSEKALSAFDDNTFDWIYIDGNHNEPFVSNDLRLASAKVRPGGVICGDDYRWASGDTFPVRDAVMAFVAELGEAGEFSLIGQQFAIRLLG